MARNYPPGTMSGSASSFAIVPPDEMLAMME
jgi:hypothetical protein